MPIAELNDSLPTVVQLLLDKGLLSPEQSEELRNAQPGEGGTVETLLVEKGLATEQDVAEVYSEYLGAPIFALPEDVTTIDRTVARQLPEKLCRDQMIAPIAVDAETIEVAFVNPDGLLIVDEIEFLTGLVVRPVITARTALETLIEIYFSANSTHKAKKRTIKHDAAPGKQAAKLGRPMAPDEVDDDEDEFADDEEVLNLDQSLPPGPEGRVIQIVNDILEQALKQGASDIHIEPFEETCRVRIRVDGVLHELISPPQSVYLPVVSRFKILAKMDIAEKRVPQDGAIGLRTAEKRIDLRVSTVPTVWGEKIVMRILDKAAIPVQLTGLGFDERQSKDLTESIESPHGLMLVTGPTGSGKSTTLYACLNFRNQPDVNICTVEDPVEYKFDGMNQIQVKSQVGLTFASVLRALLRQDPDVIMVGEVRDQETAQICLRAALTGHFVLSTIHTNDSLSAVSRLQDMGIEPFLLAATLRVLEAQRLIRRLCKDCKQPDECDEATSRLYGFDSGHEIFRAKGCDKCRGTGYRGRVGVFEVVRITSNMGELIQKRTPLPELREAARGEGMKMLGDSALDKARQGITSLEEALSIAMAKE
ncbi:MAG TPA: ATPase, T2SS/T4P/T4SS family [Pirellulales bacterium]|jgi:type IV pilus assembly protein PilB